MTTSPFKMSSNPTGWTGAIKNRIRFLEKTTVSEEWEGTKKALIEGCDKGPRHEANRYGKFHADLINFTDMLGYKNGR